ncbi:hypothetical protein [Nostoc sp. LEGE 12450]|uniref:hypothetical protein n=1 Tax=Nostoc sp. LEGE 12450 TaxID=1828643 RepID=UPI00188305B8|nr:hypothetical protein [Nostoc sp. LEGE 12450]MBE8989127.1 hypothetical protein [Nostoc sp. LEGE 12450]
MPMRPTAILYNADASHCNANASHCNANASHCNANASHYNANAFPYIKMLCFIRKTVFRAIAGICPPKWRAIRYFT